MISVITPTFNSSNCIHRLHSSLKSQTEKDFEWIVVDDGSKDNTLDILSKLSPPGHGGMFVYQMPFNSGGGIAGSVGVIKSSGSITTIIDHDDELVPSALSTIKDYFKKIEDKNEVAIVLFPSIQPDSGKQISSLEAGEIFKISYFVYKEKDCVDGVMAWKGNLARHYYKFSDCAKTVLSSVIWLRVSQNYYFEYAGGSPILLYHMDNDQSTTNSIRVSNHLVHSFARILDYHDRYFYMQPLKWVRHTFALFHFSISYYKSPFPVYKSLSRWSTKIWFSLLMPFSFIAHFFKPKFKNVEYKEMDSQACANIIQEVKNTIYHNH